MAGDSAEDHGYQLRLTGQVLYKQQRGGRASVSARSTFEEVAKQANVKLLGAPTTARRLGSRASATTAAATWRTQRIDPSTTTAPIAAEPEARNEQIVEAIERLHQIGEYVVEPEYELWLSYDGGADAPPKSPTTHIPPAAWHLDQIGHTAALASIPNPPPKLRVAVLDTGYQRTRRGEPALTHEVLASMLAEGRLDVKSYEDFWDDNVSLLSKLASYVIRSEDHGTCTTGLLAGNTPRYTGINPYAEVLPVRISPSVFHLCSGSMGRGIYHAIDKKAAVINICMGGLPSQMWADAVNEAYEKGIIICAASGNNFSALGARIPTTDVAFPARFGRTIGVAGITRAGRGYHESNDAAGNMFGNYGEGVDICAPTPNIHWPHLPNAEDTDLYTQGQGTSAATPQVSGAIALWLARWSVELAGVTGWQRVELARRALCESATRISGARYMARDAGGWQRLTSHEFGDGRLDMARLLATPPAAATSVARTPRDTVDGLLRRVITGRASVSQSGGAIAPATLYDAWVRMLR